MLDKIESIEDMTRK